MDNTIARSHLDAFFALTTKLSGRKAAEMAVILSTVALRNSTHGREAAELAAICERCCDEADMDRALSDSAVANRALVAA